jgi:hypothetical protein
VISYEFPLNERIRTLLRLEDLYERAQYFASKCDPEEHHVALTLLFEILEVGGRADLKSEIIWRRCAAIPRSPKMYSGRFSLTLKRPCPTCFLPPGRRASNCGRMTG